MTNMTPKQIEDTMNFEDLLLRQGFEAYDAEAQSKLMKEEMKRGGR